MKRTNIIYSYSIGERRQLEPYLTSCGFRIVNTYHIYDRETACGTFMGEPIFRELRVKAGSRLEIELNKYVSGNTTDGSTSKIC